ncbi:MAG: tRNA (N6-isopentenyl adenosine(37)-C2)-methylthiotransferase MiaB [Candidatus Neomarinimicrobiota bacterium]|jgi:tRNA-2-methylthio-N6-dimethylallyladenosine synthase|nr:tRNA (N6-isopentenyl adenosine(37)-C2)-methylthiotransferase MiaB [Candidatus Neomarinimicrobiota bacterium]MDX9779846.1 tRNA (N6-isopentenyl adenosine(37)-C2)-methylthiotransferase MiaB [bacterium]
MKKRFYIETYGCQMNEYDSELLSGILINAGYSFSADPEEADLILLNTCSVRDHAEQKIHSRLGELKQIKDRHPQLKIGLLGCMAQNVRDEILTNKPYVDLILGPDAYRNILEHLQSTEKHAIDTKLSKYEVYEDLFPARKSGINAWISISRGCDKFCSYCIVPYTRGRERSRKVSGILTEARKAVEQGFVEITLLGQNVNSYRDDEKSFPDLLRALAEKVSGIRRIRYISPHPQDVDAALMQVHAEYKPLIANHIHLPLQSGSNSVLAAMNRSYTREHYLKRVEMIRQYVPDMGISTDIIVGFPGEGDRDFRDTLDIMRQVRYDSAFTFKYSPRPHTKAIKLQDDVSDTQKTERLLELIALQKEHTLQRFRAMIGKELDILVESGSKRRPEEMMGRTSCGKVVVFPKANYLPGDLIRRRITNARGVTLISRENVEE